jgi:hypothetical protein
VRRGFSATAGHRLPVEHTVRKIGIDEHIAVNSPPQLAVAVGGSCLARARRWDEVIQLAETGLGHSPGYEPLHYYHVLAWLKCGNRSMAIGAFTRHETVLRKDQNRECSDRMRKLKRHIPDMMLRPPIDGGDRIAGQTGEPDRQTHGKAGRHRSVEGFTAFASEHQLWAEPAYGTGPEPGSIRASEKGGPAPLPLNGA